MHLARLVIQGVRSLSSAELQVLSRVNIVCGSNGSGKTSILESIYILSAARSFRTNKIAPVVRHGNSSCQVFAESIPQANENGPRRIGVSRGLRSRAQIKVDGSLINSVGELASLLPVVVINSDSFNLLEGGPGQRRQYLDWIVFHVEHRFFSAWRSFQLALKQRNALLRSDRIEGHQIEAWNQELERYGSTIDQLREAVFHRLADYAEGYIAKLVRLEGISIHFKRGWESELPYSEYLSGQLNQDRSAGYTRFGPHRADLLIRYRGKEASELLSRGQIKMVVSALKLAQGELLKASTDRSPLFLIDDLPSELDKKHRQMLCDNLQALNAQVFITCVDAEEILPHWGEEDKMNNVSVFHVEHGSVTPMDI